MKKKLIIIITSTLALLSSCTTSIPKDQFNLNINSSPEANNGNNYLVVYEQPSSMDKMAEATYDSLSKQILNNDHQTKLVHPQDQTDLLTFKTKDEPAALYFIMNMGKNYNTWRYYIPNPGGNSWSCSVDDKGYTSCKKDEA
ncbi:hypothetical protein IBE20_04505 [Francisella tularensis subsp. novicida]|uniref:Lipoprotein n=2 Tax=Francisella tularensis TaxID=263 RepID=A0A6I4RQK4_FRATU|nr:type VI secretion system lipoprotein IglE [Francisella tularensis]ABK88950.1 protein of unknown function [Francisella tularensis subsp. novicida U112]AJI61755.1 putative lipoprotein [Francisella tularensis subsp. novicida U112]EDX19343.1 lipoprotein, putative [Francisella tularensis subsp. novicida FTE]MBK2036006.1 hypothetical protein [Francisella tularensis subsp. novicida]MBK2115932.1 hypothetical protein [Francisella tularensis subsp. novicida]